MEVAALKPRPLLATIGPLPPFGTQNPYRSGVSAASWIKRLCWRISVPFALSPSIISGIPGNRAFSEVVTELRNN